VGAFAPTAPNIASPLPVTYVLSCYDCVTFLLLAVFMHVVVSSSALVPVLHLDTKHIETLKVAYILSLLTQTFFLKKLSSTCHTQSPSVLWCRELPGALILWRPDAGISVLWSCLLVPRTCQRCLCYRETKLFTTFAVKEERLT
jgi:hypothetical protein